MSMRRNRHASRRTGAGSRQTASGGHQLWRRVRTACLAGTATAVVMLGLAASPATAVPPEVISPPDAAATSRGHIPDIGHFSVTRTAPALLTGIRLTTGSHRVDWLQSMAFVGDDLYTMSLDPKQGNAVVRVTRLGPDGQIISHMMLEGFNYHGAVMGAASTDGQVYIWLTKVGHCSDPGCVRHDYIYRVAYSPGAIVTPSSPQAEERTPPEAISDTYTKYPQPVVDVATRRLVVRYRSGTPGHPNYVAYKLADAAAGRWTNPNGHSRRVYASSSPNPQYKKVGQGFAVMGSYAYYSGGVASNHTQPGPTNNCDTHSTTDGNTCISVVDLNTGKVIQRKKSDAFVDLHYREPEGLAIRLNHGHPQLAYGWVDPAHFPHHIYVAIQDPSTWCHRQGRVCP